MKRSFFQAAVTSILLYGCTTWTQTKRLEKKLDGNYTRMLRAILNKSWRQHPTRHQLYGHLPPITKTIQVRRTRHAGHCWRSRGELIRDVLLWTPTHDRAKAGRPARTYIQQLCEDTGCCPEDLPRAMNDREEWRERVRDIRATSAIWWWWELMQSKSLFWFSLNWIVLNVGLILIYLIFYWSETMDESLLRESSKYINQFSHDNSDVFRYKHWQGVKILFTLCLCNYVLLSNYLFYFIYVLHYSRQVVVLKTCLGRWTIGRSGERGSGIFVLPARYDDDDDDVLHYSRQVVVLKTCLGRWTIGRSGERGSGIFVLPARYDDDDDDVLHYSRQAIS